MGKIALLLKESLDRLLLSLGCRQRGDSQAFTAEVSAPPPIIHHCPVDGAAHGNHLGSLCHRDDAYVPYARTRLKLCSHLESLHVNHSTQFVRVFFVRLMERQSMLFRAELLTPVVFPFLVV